jgi:hypothetical protein
VQAVVLASASLLGVVTAIRVRDPSPKARTRPNGRPPLEVRRRGESAARDGRIDRRRAPELPEWPRCRAR